MMQAKSSCGQDYLSFNPLLCHILSLLDAKQVLRCMRVSKQFYNTILNNWREMQKIELRMYIHNDTSHESKYNYNGELFIRGSIDCRRDAGYYRFYLRQDRCHVECIKWIHPLLNQSLFHSQEEKGITAHKGSENGITQNVVEPAKPKLGWKNKLLIKLGRMKQPEGGVWAPRFGFAGSFSLASVGEGLGSVLKFLLSKSNLISLTLGRHGPLSEEYLQLIWNCVRNTEAKLTGAIIYQYSKTIKEILKHLEVKEIEVYSDKVLDDCVLLLPTERSRTSIYIASHQLVSLAPVILLAQEWHQGKRDIQFLQISCGSPQQHRLTFTVREFKEMLSSFGRMTVVSSSETDLKASIGRECDSKGLLFEYKRKGIIETFERNYWPYIQHPGGLITMQETRA